ncbi:MAG TPA: TMEM165/GDT1 family protein [Mycobacterium sp.]|nr:TMEM165/GDT1 family protein [Mycobacterium sp.]
MLVAALISLGVVFLAELGDKSQLITLTYALRHRWWVVLSGAGIAAFTVHGISVTVGHFLGLTLPQRPIAAIAGVAFIAFAAWTWRAGNTADAGTVAVREPRFVLFAVTSSIVLAELGDKTMLATVALASDHNWAGVWAGATAGMVLADAVAIAVGMVLHRRLPERFLHTVASLLFLGFGLWVLFDGALGWHGVAIASAAVVALATITVGLLHFAPVRRQGHVGGPDLHPQ